MSEFTNIEKGKIDNKECYFCFDQMFEPLEKHIPEKQRENFMFMGYSPDDKIFKYKHTRTRRYLNIDEKGNFYQYTGEDYKKIDKESAIEYSLS